ncbi:MAG: energy-coupling factor transporter transmembrane component T [Bryobacterales bacterium]|nr:energy-coupling factor transporter transmembrane protein EcfT [Bryobacteraceae bacterium]MDW8355476.1 energy-coupling factor transporter transmembrane component T [Bryobacterales bacterium]
MRHLVLEDWSRKESWLHARDPRAKLMAAVALLLAIGTSPAGSPSRLAGYALLLLAGVIIADLPVRGVWLRACVVLPFAGVFGVLAWLAGEPGRAAAVGVKSYLSAWTLVLLAATTPLPALLRGLASFGVPRFLLIVIQLLYRYLFVIAEQAHHMRLAAASRGGGFRLRSRQGWRAGAGAVATLFARSHARAEAIHRAMLARGYRGEFPLASPPRFGLGDALLSLWASAAAAALRLA